MANPSQFFLGVLDFFGILLPGAIAAALLEPVLADQVFGALVARPTGGAVAWITFLVVAYFLGHLLFLVGAWLDPIYDRLRRLRHPDGDTSAFKAAERIRNRVLTAEEQVPVNTFQWSRSILLAKCPAAAQDVHRLEADSKFFRSLVVVSALAVPLFFSAGHMVAGAVALLFLGPCFARYYERRRKSTTQAYIHVVTLYRAGVLVPLTD